MTRISWSGILIAVAYWVGVLFLSGLGVKGQWWVWIALAVWSLIFLAYVRWLTKSIRRLEILMSKEGTE